MDPRTCPSPLCVPSSPPAALHCTCPPPPPPYCRGHGAGSSVGRAQAVGPLVYRSHRGTDGVDRREKAAALSGRRTRASLHSDKAAAGWEFKVGKIEIAWLAGWLAGRLWAGARARAGPVAGAGPHQPPPRL
ncbi:uncharacterized protein PSFLO_03638 [Pseudozyma flocculosa]|uniref:Uncharacterized protein n=1 Tax=Pseudozyma flocculosa TaxID=84751 RepID=A0A5C3F4L1_9BASI|nr:uncharacterized protein PSFLO_03638 [Pseudozyma flocculosa]